MPTALIEYRQKFEGFSETTQEALLRKLANELPYIVAPQLNIVGRKLHNGGVGESEIIVDAREYSRFARNVNDIQITVRAHCYKERVERINFITGGIRRGVMEVMHDFGHNGKIGIEVDLIEMGYATIGKED